MRSFRNSDSGSIIVLALFLVLFLALLMFSVELLHRSEFEMISVQINELKALYCAEAGAERYIARASTVGGAAPTGAVWTNVVCNTESTLTLDGALTPAWTYSITASKTATDPNEGSVNLFTVYSTGKAGYNNNFQRTIEVIFRTSRAKQAGGADLYWVQILRWREY